MTMTQIWMLVVILLMVFFMVLPALLSYLGKKKYPDMPAAKNEEPHGEDS